MKKSVFASVKPLAMATAVAAGTSMSMIAVALPGGDTSGAAGVVNESVCFNTVDMTIASGVRSVTTGTGECQLRTLPPTKGLVLAESTPAGATVTDSSALVGGGGEAYETYVGGNRQGSLLLTPNRSLAVTRSSSFATGTDGAVSFDLGAAVQPSTGLQTSWLTGTYNIVQRQHSFQQVASGLENSSYAAPNTALGERNKTSSMQVTFNGDGTCSIDAMDNRESFSLTKDPMMLYLGEMDNGCTVGGGSCGQNDGNNYVAMGNVNMGSTGSAVDYYDWNDANNPDGKYGEAVSCSYTTSAGVASVTYTTHSMNVDQDPQEQGSVTWSVNYNVSADLRYLVAAETGTQGDIGGSSGTEAKGDIAVGVRVGAGDVSGKTYLFNMTAATLAASTPSTPSYENPANPTYQEEECISRGSIAFVADGTCTMQSVSSCAGRHKSGYEETAAGAGDGTIVDSLTAADGADSAPTSCSWTNSGGLVVSVGTTDPESNPITITYTGDVSDNGEALVLQGEYSVEGPAPDVQNAPLLPQQKYNMVNFMVAQEYQGDLAADADADGQTNYADFVWAADVTPAPLGGKRYDLDADGDSDALMRSSSTGAFRKFDVQSGAVAGNGAFPLYSSLDQTYQASLDVDGDGDKDQLQRSTSTGAWRLFIVQGGAVVSNGAFPLYTSADQTLKAVGDFDGDGDDDVLMRSTSTGAWRLFNVQAGAIASNSAFPLYASNDQVLQFVGDLDADGDADVTMRSTSTGAWRKFDIQGGAVVGNSAFPLYSSADQTYQGNGDLDNDGDTDVLMRSTSTGGWRKFSIQSGAVVANSGFALYAAADQTLQALGDYDADGDYDALMRSTSTGAWRKFDIQSGAVVSNGGFSLYSTTDQVLQNK